MNHDGVFPKTGTTLQSDLEDAREEADPGTASKKDREYYG
jgi:hypothetical protein